MNNFINIKSLAGELKRTEIRRGIAYQLTTREFILQREDVTYHILLDDILGLVQRDDTEALPSIHVHGDETRVYLNGPTYKIVATKMRLYNRSGVFEKGATTLYTSLSEGFSKLMVDYLHHSNRTA